MKREHKHRWVEVWNNTNMWQAPLLPTTRRIFRCRTKRCQEIGYSVPVSHSA
jgi:hypothetical protein